MWQALDTRVLDELPADVTDCWPPRMVNAGGDVAGGASADGAGTETDVDIHPQQRQLVYGLAAMHFTAHTVAHMRFSGELDVELTAALSDNNAAVLLRLDGEPVLASVVAAAELPGVVCDLLPVRGEVAVAGLVRPAMAHTDVWTDVPIAITGVRDSVKEQLRTLLRAHLINAAMFVSAGPVGVGSAGTGDQSVAAEPVGQEQMS